MPAFSSQDRPRAAYTCSVVGGAIVLLAISIMIVTPPDRTLRQVMLDDAVDYLDRITHNRIIGRANPEAHQMEEIASDNVARRVQTAAVGELKHRCIRIGVRIGRRRIRRIDADVMPWKTFD